MKQKYTTLLFISCLWFSVSWSGRASDVKPVLLSDSPFTYVTDFYDNNPIFKIYPNPSDGKTFQLMFTTIPSEKIEIVIYNSIGNMVYKKVVEEELNEGIIQITPDKVLKSGLYFVVVNLERQLYMQRLLVK